MKASAGVILAILGAFCAWSIAGTQLAAAALVPAFIAAGGWRVELELRNRVVGFTALCGLSVLFTAAAWQSFEVTAWKPALLAWVAAGTVAVVGQRDAERVIAAWVGAACVVSCWAIVQAATGQDLLHLLHLRSSAVFIPSPGWPGHAATTGFFNSRLTFSLALLPAFGAAGGLALAGRGWTRGLGVAGVVVVGAALILGFVRAAWIGAVVVGGLLALLGPRKARWAGLGMLAVILGSLTMPQVRARARSAIRVSDNEDRVFIWSRAQEVIRDHPALGVGFGAYPLAAEPYYDRADPAFPMHTWAHDTPLSLLAETGPLGLIFYLALWAAVFTSGWRAVRSGSASALGLFAGLVGLHLASLFHDILYNGEVAYALYLGGGLLAGLGSSAHLNADS